MEKKNKGGRPKKFKSVAELEKKIAAYFAECDARDRPYTVTGLALALDTTRKTLCDFENYPEFSNAIKRAKTRVEMFAEERLFSSNCTGAIFALKNFGWRDKPVEDDDEDAVSVPVSITPHVQDATKGKPDAESNS
jgi:hypothetical protein